ncbi:MAG: ribose-phosphate pyrophosphokinase-like domain-containing protein [Rickettsiales bacterium]
MNNLIIFCNSSKHLLCNNRHFLYKKNIYLTNIKTFSGLEREISFEKLILNDNLNFNKSKLTKDDLNNILKLNSKIIINQSFCNDVNADIMELLLTIETLVNYLVKNNKNNKIYINLMHFPYARQDKEKEYITSVGKRLILKMLENFKDYIVEIKVCDEHSSEKINNYPIKITNIFPIYLINYIMQNFAPQNSIIILPDYGASKRFSLSLMQQFKIIILDKMRQDNNQIKYNKMQNHIINNSIINFLILDDMLVSGDTCAKAIQYLIKTYNLDVNKIKFYILCSHFFSFAIKLENCTNIYKIITTNSIANQYSLGNQFNNIYKNNYINLNLKSLLQIKGQDYIHYIDILQYFFV